MHDPCHLPGYFSTASYRNLFRPIRDLALAALGAPTRSRIFRGTLLFGKGNTKNPRGLA
jgi:hypothetical protein